MLFVGVGLMWGSAYLLIAIGLESFDPAMVTFLRILLGVLVLGVVPAARRARIARDDWARIALLGLLWLAVPLTLFSFAQQWVDSSVAGMLTGAQPLLTAALAAFLMRRRPRGLQVAGLLVGFAGILAITITSVGGSQSTSPWGVVLVLVAIGCYAVSVNLAVPLQQRYGGLAVILRAMVIALVLVSPLGIWSLFHASYGPDVISSLAAVALLGAVSTGVAYVAFTTLVGRTGATRGASAVYLIPVVAIVLGTTIGHESVPPAALLGSGLVLVGAFLMSRADDRS